VSQDSPGIASNSLLALFAAALALAAIVLAVFIDFDGMIDRMQDKQLKDVASAITEFKATFGRYPEIDEGVAVLWDRTVLSSAADASHWRPFLREEVNSDQWGHPLEYTPTNLSDGSDGFELRSRGWDGRLKSGDDRVVSGGGGAERVQ